MSKLIVHLGAHRTGTTLIQHYLSEKTSDLMKHGVFYAPVEGKTAQAINILRRDQSAGAVKEAAAAFQKRYDLQREITVVSWEGMLGLPFAQGSLYGGVGPFLRMLTEVGEAARLDIMPIVYIRNQPDFVTSWYAQLVKAGAAKPFNEYLEDVPTKSLYWSTVLSDIENALGAVHTEAYESIDIDPAGYADPILRLCGAPSFFGQLPQMRVNQSYSAEALQLAQFVNTHGNMSIKARLQFRKLLVSMLPGQRPTLLSRNQIVKMLARYESDNVEILHRARAPDPILMSYRSPLNTAPANADPVVSKINNPAGSVAKFGCPEPK